ncbi:Phosphoglycolate phosphatase, plasmid [Austwickia sp. TVS 96-490-7B]|uniref:HAD family hydrolase n=1 Tax=Austwickia sp. TVS 96-490-7B TaxID=2830843 RepID=UPI001C56A153|nr:HAD family hydrolase [Austwickia sp. TVS 96-490-7B]MBW3086866.1 Phosphoglycolate phosphatase, plasmid [Austwickia sp. TVS 96-490-7B]
MTTIDAGQPIDAVLFDFHSTLVDQGDASQWLADAWRRTGRTNHPSDPLDQGGLGPHAHRELTAYLHRVWEHSHTHDPDNHRDRDTTTHRAVWNATMTAQPHGDPELFDALYASMLDQWLPYEDTLPTLQSLRDAGIRTAVLSNVGIDLTPVLRRTGIADAVDAVVMSYQVGSAKPEPQIFRHTLDLLDVSAERALMAGDSWRDDSGAAAVGIRTLLLPRTVTPAHGLGLVLRLVGR